MSEILTEDGLKEISHDDVKRCDNCGTSVRAVQEGSTELWYEENKYGTWIRHDCSLP